ncbi:hypothetical protein AVEN_213136-1 [Araneus ventricosus]|uniref:Uncharacterized protein n=1 Tax=Araneus ventricosus TaxID=182803 RepID=A0A4Y2RMB8_ARAVE|nr:hypothetical protein AVEN_213136-1 [Araneus ventricosus]
MNSKRDSKDVRAERRSQSINVRESINVPFHSVIRRTSYMVSPAGRDVTKSSSTFKRISSPSRDIEKIPPPLKSIFRRRVAKFAAKVAKMVTSLSPRSVQAWLLPVTPYLTCKTLIQPLRLTLLGSDFPMFVMAYTLGALSLIRHSLKPYLALVYEIFD